MKPTTPENQFRTRYIALVELQLVLCFFFLNLDRPNSALNPTTYVNHRQHGWLDVSFFFFSW